MTAGRPSPATASAEGAQFNGRPSPWLLGPVLTALALFALAHRDAVFAVLCALALLGASRHRLTFALPTRQQWPLVVGIVLVAWAGCGAYYEVMLQAGSGLSYFPRLYYKPWLITTVSMMLALTVVWVWHTPGTSPHTTEIILGGTGLMAVSSGNFLELPALYVPCLMLFLGTTLVALVALGSGVCHWPGWTSKARMWQAAVVLGCLVAVSTGTWAVSATLPGFEKILSAALMEMLQGTDYTDVIGAGDMMYIERHRRLALPHKIVATIGDPTPPGYLRTQVMTHYRNGLWKSDRTSARLVSPVAETPGMDGQRFELPRGDDPGRAGLTSRPGGAEDRHTPMAWPRPTAQRDVSLFVDLRGAVPLPYTARSMTTSAAVSCAIAEGGILQCTPPEEITGYTVESSTMAVQTPYRLSAAPQASAEVQQAREAPEAVLAPLRGLAQRVVGPYAVSALEAAQLLRDYFRRHYIYSLTVDLAEHGDPIVDFVLHRRPAYCEYYAAGLTLMLRALDIPARVGGGFVVNEYNALAGQWIVRQRDAHAWTEVFDATSGAWVAFDATPLAVVAPHPEPGVVALAAQSWAWITLPGQFFLTRAREASRHAWLTALGHIGSDLLHRPTRWLALGLGVILLLGGTQRHWLVTIWTVLQQRLANRRSVDETDTSRAEVRRLFDSVTYALAEHGVPIGPAETVEDYLWRVRGRPPVGDVVSEVALETACTAALSVPCRSALERFAQAYIALRFHRDGLVVAEVDASLETPLSLAALRCLADQVVAALQPQRPLSHTH